VEKRANQEPVALWQEHLPPGPFHITPIFVKRDVTHCLPKSALEIITFSISLVPS
jgi:hypothetical protein